MKTFKDLEFELHDIAKETRNTGIGYFKDATQAVMEFPNGYGISVITGTCFYTDILHPFECAVVWGNHLCYDTPITDDVIGHCNTEDVTNIMKQIQKLPKVKK